MSELELSDLAFSFGGVRVVDRFSLDVRAEEVTALIGPNGAGKTTLLNLASGFLNPDSGSVSLNGLDVTLWRPDRIARAGISRSFQEMRLIGDLQVAENVLLAMPNQKGETLAAAVFRARQWYAQRCAYSEKAEAHLHRLGLSEKAETPAKELSYGQQKALVLACCMASESRVFLLDEPFAGLDPAVSDLTQGVLRELAANGSTVLFVEHNLSIVAELADRVCVMDRGTKIADGPPRIVLNLPKTLEAYLS